MPETIGQLIKRHISVKGKRSGEKYSPELRVFALSLRFYSSRAYDYVRKTFNNLLPGPSTIRCWYKVVDGRPGFTDEALKIISKVVENKNARLQVSLVMDEIAIRKGVTYKSNKLYGYVNLGTYLMQEDGDNLPLGKSVLVFMIVSLTYGWKTPIAYFVIDSLSAKERANLLEIALQLLHEAKADVRTITFDGAATNLSMCRELGADFRLGNNFAPYFRHPTTTENIYIMWDPCHMLKLVRNAFAELGDFEDGDGKVISWQHIKKLHEIQNTEGLSAATKLTNKHLNFRDNKMNVRKRRKSSRCKYGAESQDTKHVLLDCDKFERFICMHLDVQNDLITINQTEYIDTKAKTLMLENSRPLKTTMELKLDFNKILNNK